MRFVVPVSQSDKQALDKQVQVFTKLGGWRAHQLLFAPAPSCLNDCNVAAESLKDFIPGVEVHSVAREPSGGWPSACNAHFQDTVMLLARLENKSPWMWLELDATPLREGWQDALETAYNTGKKPFCGHVRLTAEVNPDKKGFHMVGSGIYPANFHVIAEAEYRAIPRNEPFDVSLRWRVTASGVTNTSLIAHNHSSRDYSLEGDFLLTPEGYKVNASDVAVLHGCKDGSVADLVLSGALEKFGPLIKTAAVPVQHLLPSAPKPTLEVMALSAGWRKVMDGVLAHPTVSNEQISAALGVQTSAQASQKPPTDIDAAIERLWRSTPTVPAGPLRLAPGVLPSEAAALSQGQNATQGDPAGGSLAALSPHETLSLGTNLPETGVDNGSPPIHTVTDDAGLQGEKSGASSLAPPEGDSQIGQPFQYILDQINAGRKPTRVKEYATELQLPPDELKLLIKEHPESGLAVAPAGWVSIAA